MSKNNTFETLLGLLVLIVSSLFIFYVYSSQHTVSGNLYTIHANFQKIDGINVGNDVKLSGVKVGTVSAIDVDIKNFQAKLSISIRNDLKIPTDSSLEIASEGLLGGKYVSITPGGNEENVKPGGSIFQTVSAMSLENLLSKYLTSSSHNLSDTSPKSLVVESKKELVKKEDPKTNERTSDKKDQAKKQNEPSQKKISTKKEDKPKTKAKSDAQLVNEDLFASEDSFQEEKKSPKPYIKKKKNNQSLAMSEDSYLSDFDASDNFINTDRPEKKSGKKATKKQALDPYYDDFSSSKPSYDNQDFEDKPKSPKTLPQDSAKMVEDILNQSFGQFSEQKPSSNKKSDDSLDGEDNEDSGLADEE